MDFQNIPSGKINKISFTRPDYVDQKLYVIAPIFNSQRYRSMWKHYNEFEHYVIDSGAHLVTIEAVFGERQKAISEQISPNHTVIHVHAKSELWIKENLVNIAAARLPDDAQYIAVIDPDVRFQRFDWVGEAIQRLQHYDVVQMFRVAADTDPNGIPYQYNRGFVYDYLQGLPIKMQFSKQIKIPNLQHRLAEINNAYCEDCPDYNTLKINYFHPGFAWCYTKKAFSALGGLIDFAILGSADAHMAAALVGHFNDTVHPKLSEEYKKLGMIWQERATKHINGNIGYMDGVINHFFHGAKKNRKYGNRQNILVEFDYTPSTDIKKDWNGVYYLENNKPRFRDAIRRYFAERNADSTSMEGSTGFLD